MYAVALIIGYCLLVVMASLAGGSLPSFVKLTHIRIQLIMSFVSGIMLGVALLHMMPHAIEHLAPSQAAASMLVGVLAMFFLLRVFHVHHREDLDHEHHDDHCDHSHNHGISWFGLFVGLTVHSLFDGVALAAGVFGDAGHGELRLLGFSTFLAVLLHKPLDSLSITSLMVADGWSTRHQIIVNCVFALVCPVGALLFWFGATHFATGPSAFVGGALAFSAGFFLCIALSDLLPEVAFHSHDRWKLSAALLLGVGLAVGIEMTHAGSHDDELPHPHEHPPVTAAED